MEEVNRFPEQQLSFKRKNKEWRKKCVEWAANRTYFNYSPVRKSVRNMKINQDLVNGVVHMEDMMRVINPTDTQAE